jgi:NAD(P)-dependent dehydrogenase (short-subunit alcohol dehydrogenase family)
MRVLLTGATGGIGSEIHNALVSEGIEVLADRIDLSRDFVINESVDGLIHCAGINIVKHHRELQFPEFERLFHINTWSFVKLCSQLKFSKGSNVIAIGSLYANSTKAGRIQYSMSKHALLAAVKTLALELSEDQIKVNMVSPGFVDTHMTRKNNTESRIQDIKSLTPLKDLISPQEIANFCLYLMKYNRNMTGQNIEIDGGYKLVNA